MGIRRVAKYRIEKVKNNLSDAKKYEKVLLQNLL